MYCEHIGGPHDGEPTECEGCDRDHFWLDSDVDGVHVYQHDASNPARLVYQGTITLDEYHRREREHIEDYFSDGEWPPKLPWSE